MKGLGLSLIHIYFDKEGWKKRQLFTEYYTANLHIGAFMLPKYVEDILEEEEGRK